MRSRWMLVLVGLVAVALVAVGATTCGEPPPAGPRVLVQSLIPPLHDAAVGESLRLTTGSDSELYRVVGASDYEVTVEVTRYHGDVPVESPISLTWHRNNFGLPANTTIRAFDPDRIEVGGVRYECWRLSVYSRDTSPRTYWISDKIPVHGVLKVATVGKDGPDEATAAKLADWGPR